MTTMRKTRLLRKAAALLLAGILVLSVAGSALADLIGGPGTMYVYTENGKTLNVRSSPNTGDNIIGSLAYGASVYAMEFDGDWTGISWGDGIAYVQSRFLQWYEPGPKPDPQPDPQPTAAPEDAELRSEVSIPSLRVQAVATRSSGWANMRVAPSKNTRRVEACSDGTELIAFGETTNWYHVQNPATGNSGYIRKDFLKVLPTEQPVVDTETQIGRLNVNGDFTLQGVIPEGYTLQVISGRGAKVIAALVSEDASRPQMMLTVAFDEMYAGVARMNDLSDGELETLKASYTAMNDVEFSEAETAAGTKLLIVRENGTDEDFVSILSVYRGYSVEFVLSPNPNAASAVLTDAQIQTAIDFLSNLEFVPAG